MKKLTLKKLKKKACDLHSKVVRMRAKGVCFTCGDQRHWKEQHAGHVIHRDSLDFDEIAIQCQCEKCNETNCGESEKFATRLVNLYGLAAVEDIRWRANEIRIFTRDEIEDFIKQYKSELEKLEAAS